MSHNQGNAPGQDPLAQVRKGERPDATALIVGRDAQPLGFMDSLNARVPGFEDITDQPDWGDNGFSGRKSDARVVRFDRLPEAADAEDAQAAVDTDA
jgi:hypothetical protein